jgi:hypothetical protein
MKKWKKRLKQAWENFREAGAVLRVAQANVERLRKAAQKNHRKCRSEQRRADNARKRGDAKGAARHDRRAHAFGSKAKKLTSRKDLEIDRCRRLHNKRHDIKLNIEEIEQKITKYDKEHGVHVDVPHNELTGGSFEQRIELAGDVACTRCAISGRDNYYDQMGLQNYKQPFTGPKSGRDRSDCSIETTSWFFVAGGPDPSGNEYGGPMWTGSIEANGHEVSMTVARDCPFAQVVFGPRGATHHVEKMRGNGTGQTQGHGSGPVDIGSDTMLSGERHYYVPKQLAHLV